MKHVIFYTAIMWSKKSVSYQTLGKPMSAKLLVEKLKALSLAHETIAGTQGLVKQHSELVRQKETTLATLADQIVKIDSEFKQAQKNIASLELELSSIQEQESKLQKTLKTLKKQKECVAIERELSLLARKRYDTERTLEDACNSIGQLKHSHAAEKSRIQHEQQAIKNDLALYVQNETKLQQKLSAAEQTWSTALHEVPTEWQSKYARMLNSVTNPIVAINKTVCGACFYTVVEKDLQRIKLGEILACRSCYRFLYNQDHVSPLETPEHQAQY